MYLIDTILKNRKSNVYRMAVMELLDKDIVVTFKGRLDISDIREFLFNCVDSTCLTSDDSPEELNNIQDCFEYIGDVTRIYPKKNLSELIKHEDDGEPLELCYSFWEDDEQEYEYDLI